MPGFSLTPPPGGALGDDVSISPDLTGTSPGGTLYVNGTRAALNRALTTMHVRPAPDMNGFDEIRFFADDGEDIATASFTLLVHPVNDPATLAIELAPLTPFGESAMKESMSAASISAEEGVVVKGKQGTAIDLLGGSQFKSRFMLKVVDPDAEESSGSYVELTLRSSPWTLASSLGLKAELSAGVSIMERKAGVTVRTPSPPPSLLAHPHPLSPLHLRFYVQVCST